jgi:hypothetical protein
MKTKKQTPAPTPLHGLNGQLMAIAAHRYCLGRQTYIVSCCVEWLKAWWRMVDHDTRNVILRDTAEALARNEAGAPMDAQDWQGFLDWAKNEKGQP